MANNKSKFKKKQLKRRGRTFMNVKKYKNTES
jgi:hypothetical protein